MERRHQGMEGGAAVSDTPKTDNLCLDLDDGFARQSDLIAFARDLERENAALRAKIAELEHFLSPKP